jgi:acyl-CoA thioester hydrolase
MGIVHHSTYLLWFELGRTGLLAAAGFPYAGLEREGTLFPVVEFACRLVGSADYGDTVTIETRVCGLRSRMVEFAYRVINKGEVLAIGKTRHVATGRDLKPRRLPDGLFAALRGFADLSPRSENP